MKVFILAILFFLVTDFSFGQNCDTVINMGNYRSYFSYAVKNPLYVTYTLKKGGGNCDRRHFSFKACGLNTATDEDYAHSGYEPGHMANAEDFAYDCILDKSTFCFFNCVPQTRKLNRGIWKTWEKKVRDLSHSRAVFVIAGAIYGQRKLKDVTDVAIPEFCYKIVVDPPTHNILYCLLFPNDNSGKVESLSLAQLKARLPYSLLPYHIPDRFWS